jgi:hypothetical protein
MSEPAKTKEEFIGWIADRYVIKADLDPIVAIDAAKTGYQTTITDEGLEFGQEGHDWTQAAAFEIADEEMSCWEAE